MRWAKLVSAAMPPSEPNPYAPPSEHADADVRGELRGYWRQGTYLMVTGDGASLPDRCVRCNQPAQGRRVRHTAHWHPSWVYLTLALTPLLYLVIALLLRHSVELELGLCRKHQRARTAGRTLLLAALVVPFALIAADLIVVGTLVFAGGLMLGLSQSRVVRAVRIDSHRARLKVSDAFLRSIPARRPRSA